MGQHLTLTCCSWIAGVLDISCNIYGMSLLYGGIRWQSMEKQVCKNAFTGGTSITSFDFFLNKLPKNELSRPSLK